MMGWHDYVSLTRGFSTIGGPRPLRTNAANQWSIRALVLLLCGVLSLSGNPEAYAEHSVDSIQMSADSNSHGEIPGSEGVTAGSLAIGNDEHMQVAEDSKSESFE